MSIEIEITEDGSHTFYVPELDEHYHSTHGAIQESMHVFIDSGMRKCAKKELKILEIGFGTGLNAFLTLIEAKRKGIIIDYTTIELFPVSMADAMRLNYSEFIDKSSFDLFLKLHSVAWEQQQQITTDFSILKTKIDFSFPLRFSSEKRFDVIYYDAFAPDKQPEMWTQEIFDKIYSLTSDNAILTTYCAKGVVRRMLQSAGFTVERLPGPPGKREILRATKHDCRIQNANAIGL